ncbi:MAG: metal-dependent hydrolase [Halolamina sp.]
MWPWEHAAVGYLLFSLGLRALGREPPTERETVLLVAATQLPDLVDKPLSWGLGWFPSGFAVAHSAFVAVPAGLAAIALGWRAGRTRAGIATVVGYWSHLAGDVLNPVRYGGVPLPARVLWPVADVTPYETDYGLGRGFVYVGEFLASLPPTDPVEVLVFYVALPASSLALWLRDGAPGTTTVGRLIAVSRHRIRQ